MSPPPFGADGAGAIRDGWLGRLVGGLVGLAAVSAVAQTTDRQLTPQQSVLNIVWEVAASPTDRMSTTDPTEARRFKMLGPVYYVAGLQAPGLRPLYRMRHAQGDHRSDLALAPGYTLESTLGYVWPSGRNPPGTEPLGSGMNPRTGDHALLPRSPTPPAGYTAATLPDAMAWPRPAGKAPSLLALDGQQVRIASNLAAGGALWSLTWRGEQFIDQLDYGRLVQSSLSFSGAGASRALPTEGGDQTADADPAFMHGAPLLSASNTRSAQGATQSTRAIPLEWRHTEYNGGHPAQPVAYPGWQLGKDITLDDARIDLGADRPQWRAQVLRYTTVFVNGGPALPQADIEIPTAYLRAPFRRAFTCDATQPDTRSGLREVMPAEYEQLDASTWHRQFSPPAGGVILANDGLSHALGLYGSAPEQGGSARYFTLWRFGSRQSPSVNKSSAGAGPRTLASGSHRFQTWLVVGQAQEVCAVMQRMFAKGLR